MKDNLSSQLLEKHLSVFGLENPLYIESDNDLFQKLLSPAQSAVVFLPKSKPLIDMTLALVSGMVVRDGKVILVGANKAGIGSAKKLYEANIGPVEQKITGNHSALYVGKNKKLAGEKRIEDFLSYFSLSYKDTRIEVANLPGVFSAGELDEGTKLLLDNIPYDNKKILDIGCGSGVIGAVYKKTNPQSDVTMADSSKLAVLATKKTLERNKIEAKVVESNIFDEIKDTFDIMIVNPPFHDGIKTDYSFMEKFARDAKEHLNPKGEIYVVANSFLPYKDILEKHVGETVILTDTKKFKIYKSRVF